MQLNVDTVSIVEALKTLKIESNVENNIDVSSITEAIKQIDLSTINEKISIVAEAKKLEKEKLLWIRL